MPCPYCGSDVGKTDVCPNCGARKDGVAKTGWRPDPTARHEGRYYVAGRPTGRVRDGKAETTDPDGGKLLPAFLDTPAENSTSIRSTWLATGAATAVLAMLAAFVWGVLLSRHNAGSPDADYLSTLKDSGLAAGFNSDANALAHGRQVCKQLDEGGPQQGVAADKLAVDAFCPRFSEGFRVLETANASAVFVLIDTSKQYLSSITSEEGKCHGVHGYSDIGSGTQVMVKNGKGEILASTSLGEGHGDEINCRFAFSFPITEGQDRYVVSVGRRGEFSYSFEQLRRGSVEIHLGE
ncbi:DUF732 domain-containing protein [Mycolicibacterium stellerae]|uniref:DUF732 domain-containing protein n=1 Tax=Mycolicibacterium stellerae TaxID=2358193 RepID=UPI000F0B00E7|nr:DUF732 domain-containing protein [Mycolicibacterium stellerae]